VEPPELANLVEVAERPRTGDWSLRSALVRYAQPQPVRVSQVLELVRRIEVALRPHAKKLADDGPALWDALEGRRSPGPEPEPFLVGVLQAAAVLDRLGEQLACWADDRARPRPDDEVDAAVTEVARRLDALGVQREEHDGPRPRSRS
jgi:hypothetical protein